MLRRTLAGSLDFSGRSRRTEVVVYMFVPPVAAMVIFLPLHLLAGIRLPDGVERLVSWLIAFPMIALFVRRLHDQSKSGWWALLALPATAYSVLRHWEFQTNPDFYYSQWSPLWWVNGLLVLAIFVLLFWPGNEGPNAFGSDPREGSTANSDFTAPG